MTRFTDDNTDGFGQGDLDELNSAFERIVAVQGNLHGDIARKSWEDHIAEQLLDNYDPMELRRFDALVDRLLDESS